MKRRYFLYSLILFLVIFSNACMKRQILQIQSDLSYVKNDLNNTYKKLNKNDENLKKEIENLNNKINNLASAIADINAKQDIIDSNINTLLGKIDELSYRLSNIRSKSVISPYVQPPEIKTYPSFSTKPKVLNTPTVSIPIDKEEAARIYQSAYKNFIKGKYDVAISEFQQYLNYVPNSELSDNAQYWIGESYYTQGNFSEALKAFNKVISNYPDGDKVPSALLKIGYCYLEMKKINDAIKAFENLIKTFPDSDESKIAKEQIKTIKNL